MKHAKITSMTCSLFWPYRLMCRLFPVGNSLHRLAVAITVHRLLHSQPPRCVSYASQVSSSADTLVHGRSCRSSLLHRSIRVARLGADALMTARFRKPSELFPDFRLYDLTIHRLAVFMLHPDRTKGRRSIRHLSFNTSRYRVKVESPQEFCAPSAEGRASFR